MSKHPTAFLLAACLLLGTHSAGADGFSTFESIAFQDFMVWQCSRNEPTRTSEFTKLRNPPHTCAAPDPAVVEQARKSDAYRVLNAKLAREMGALSPKQLSGVCQAALQVRC